MTAPDGHTQDARADSPGPVQHCPFCGELIGSFWARRDTDGRCYCERCDIFFRVDVDGTIAEPGPG